MQSKLKSVAVLLTFCLLLTFGGTQFLIQPVPVDAAANTSLSSQAVKLSSKSQLKISNVHFLEQDQGKVMAFRVDIQNNDSISLELNDYWVKLKDKSGKSYSVKLIETDKTKSSAPAGSTTSLTYYAFVNSAISTTDYTFEILKWDFNLPPTYESVIGKIQYKANSEKAKANQIVPAYFGDINTNLRIVKYALTEDHKNAYLNVTYAIENKGLSALDLTNYNFFVQVSDGTTYTIDKSLIADLKLNPKQKRSYTFLATLPKNAIGKPLNIIGASTEATSKLNIPLTVIEIPAIKSTSITGVGKGNVIQVNENSINTFIDKTSFYQTLDDQEVAIQFAMRNVSNEAISLPELNYFLLTKNNVLYPLSYEKPSTEVSLLPQIRNVISLTGTVPSNISVQDARLVVKMSGKGENSGQYVIAAYNLSINNNEPTGKVFSNKEYEVKLLNLFRTSSEADDLLSAELEITNTTNKTLEIPNLSGFFEVDGIKVDKDISKLSFNSKLTLSPKEKQTIYINADIPYQTKINKVAFVLAEGTEEGSTAEGKSLFRYNLNQISTIKTIFRTGSYQIDNEGSVLKASLKKSDVYSSLSDNYFYAEFEVENNGTRLTTIPQLSGYLKNSNGEVVVVKFDSYQQKVASDGKILITAWAKLSKRYDISKMEFIVGRAIPENATSENPNYFTVKPGKINVNFPDGVGTKNTLLNIPVAGYTFNMKQVYATFLETQDNVVQGLNIRFNYDLIADQDYDGISKENKINIEFIDQGTNKVTYSKDIVLAPIENKENRLVAGTNLQTNIGMEDAEIMKRITYYSDYVLNIYGYVDDTKVLLATKTLKWFSIEN